MGGDDGRHMIGSMLSPIRRGKPKKLSVALASIGRRTKASMALESSPSQRVLL